MATYGDRRMFPQRDPDSDSHLKSMKSDSSINGDDDYKTSGKRGYEMGENIPLKPSSSYNQHGFFSSGDFGLKMIILAFFVVSFAITVALIVQIFAEETHQATYSGTVVSDNNDCSKIGLELLRKGGSSVDAVIGTQFCLAVVHPHTTGIGGGGFMLIYDHSKKKTVALDFREGRPANESAEIDVNRPAMTSGVPGLLHGLQTAHKMYGKLKWEEIVRPAARIANEGFAISKYLAEAFEQELPGSKLLQILFPNIPVMNLSATGLIGRKLRQEKLAVTLNSIAEFGADVLYKGSLTVVLVETLRKLGGQLTAADFANYSTIVSEPISLHWKDKSIITMGHPSSGPPMLFAFKALENLTLTENSSMKEFVLPILEAGELAAAKNKITLNLTDETLKHSNETTTTSVPFEQLREDRGSNIVAVDRNELFVTAISGLGRYFGSRIAIDGILMNDALVHFATPMPEWKEATNVSVKRPPSTMTLAVVYDSAKTCGLRLATGAASSQLLLEVLIQKLTANRSVEDAVEAARFDVSFQDKRIYEEQNHRPSLNKDAEESLSVAGYAASTILPPYISVNMIAKIGDKTESHADSRGGGLSEQI